MQYVDFLEREPVAVYARKMGNYIATNFDEQLLSAYLFLAPGSPQALDEAFKVAFWSQVRQKDQIRNGKFFYEEGLALAAEWTSQCLKVCATRCPATVKSKKKKGKFACVVELHMHERARAVVQFTVLCLCRWQGHALQRPVNTTRTLVAQ
jgi:hypothetical protein